MAIGTATSNLLDLRDPERVRRQHQPQAVYNPRKRRLDTLVDNIEIRPNRDRDAPVSLAEAFVTATNFLDTYQRAYYEVIGTVMQTWFGPVRTSSDSNGDFSMAGYVPLLEDYDVATAEEANMRAFEDVDW